VTLCESKNLFSRRLQHGYWEKIKRAYFLPGDRSIEIESILYFCIQFTIPNAPDIFVILNDVRVRFHSAFAAGRSRADDFYHIFDVVCNLSIKLNQKNTNIQ
jgi:hypothetical protein